MRLVYLKSSFADLRWFRRYYALAFPAGAKRANAQILACIQSLLDNPELGRAIEGTPLREYPIARTPFTLVYRHQGDTVQIVRLWDARGDPRNK